MFGKQNRFCNSKWFKLYLWLDYDEISDSVTCFTCKCQHSKLNGNAETAVEKGGGDRGGGQESLPVYLK